MTTGSGDPRVAGQPPGLGDDAKSSVARGATVVPETSRRDGASTASRKRAAKATAKTAQSDQTTQRTQAAPPRPPVAGMSGASSPPAPVLTGGSGLPQRPLTVGKAPVSRKKGRRARLTVKRIDPWSTLKFSFVYGLAGMIVLLVTVVVLYSVVDAMGVINSIKSFLTTVDSNDKVTNTKASGLIVWLGFKRVMLVATIIGGVNVILFTAFATLTAFIYNVCTDIVGGIEVTLAERG